MVGSRAIVLPFSEQRDRLAEPEPEPDLRVQPDNRVRVGKAFGREAGKEDPWSRGDIGLEQSRLIPQDDRELVGKATGNLPAQFHYDCWIEVDATPRFAQFEGPLQLMGQIVRIEPVRPRLLAKPEDKEIFFENELEGQWVLNTSRDFPSRAVSRVQ